MRIASQPPENFGEREEAASNFKEGAFLFDRTHYRDLQWRT